MEFRERRPIAVACGIIARGGRILMSRRPPGAHLEGVWEFPGGKVGPGESPEAALRRELEEEVGLRTRRPVLLHRREHHYADRSVEIFFYLCTDVAKEPREAEGQTLRWFAVSELRDLPIPEANREVVALLEENLA